MSAHVATDEFRTRRNLDVFAHLPFGQRRKILNIGTIVDVDAGKVLITEGGEGNEVFIIVDGEAHVTRRGDHLATLGVGDVVGEHAVLSQTRRSATVTAASEMSVLVLTPVEFNRLLDEIPALTRQVLNAVASRSG